ncbi:MAG: glycosyltransferase family 39 protein [Melioribacteraceae bacterium]|nr:glycosyltransferase family 39 protein [Melioribacteraceae bacterium]
MKRPSDFVENRNKLIHFYPLIIICISAILIDILFYTGYYGSDDKSYVLFAHELSEGNLPIKVLGNGEFLSSTGETFDFGVLRFAFTIPITILYYFSRSDIFTMIQFVILLHILIIITSYKLGKLIGDSLTGYSAALFASFSPLFYIYSGALLPDNSEILWLLLAIYYSIKVKGNNKYHFNFINKDAALTGLFLGLSYSSKMSALIMVLPIGVYLLRVGNNIFSTRTAKIIASFALGFAAVIIVETMIIYICFGDFFTRYEIIAGMKDHYLRRAGQQGITISERLLRMWRISTKLYEPYFIYFFIFILFSFPFLMRRKLYIWFILIYGVLYKIFGTTNFSAYAPPVLQTRYFAFSVPLFGICTGLLLGKIIQLLKGNNYKQILNVIAAGVFAGVTFVNINYNLDDSGQIYRAPMLQSFNNAYNSLRHYDIGANIIVSDTCMHWLYPVLAVTDRDYYNKLTINKGAYKEDEFTYYIGSEMYDLNENKLAQLFESAGKPRTVKFLDMFHPDRNTYEKYKKSITSLFIPRSPQLRNENIYHNQRLFIIVADTASSDLNMTEQIKKSLQDYIVFYNMSNYDDVKISKDPLSHLIEWGNYNGEREIFINSFDYGLHNLPPGNRMLGSLDSTHSHFNFTMRFENIYMYDIGVQVRIYLFDDYMEVKSGMIDFDLIGGENRTINLSVNNDASAVAKNYRLQLFIRNYSNQVGKLLFDNYNVTSYK